MNGLLKGTNTKYVHTNIGEIPVEDYLDIKARQCGFEDYKDLQNQGYHINISDNDIIEK